MKVPRLHLFELEDQAWFPAWLRDQLTDFLQFFLTFFRIYDPVRPLILEMLRRSGSGRIVDLCSGASGPWVALEAALRGTVPVTVTLTDRFPNLAAFYRAARMSGNRIGYRIEPVDATAVPRDLQGARTLFTAFHHLPPEVARGVLQDAVRSGSPIGIFECVERNLRNVLLLPPLVFVLVLCTAPFVRPLQLSRLVWTYLVPLVPLSIAWDGLVSQLRAYSPGELRELAASVDAPGYRWTVGQLESFGLSRITYLIGCPVTRTDGRWQMVDGRW